MQRLQDRADALRSAVEFPEAWKPEPGETLVGEALGWACHVQTERSTFSDVRTVSTSHSPLVFVATRSQLRYLLIADKSELEKVLAEGLPRKCEPGDFVAIRFRGKSLMNDGNEAASYRVAIEKPGAEPADADIPY